MYFSTIMLTLLLGYLNSFFYIKSIKSVFLLLTVKIKHLKQTQLELIDVIANCQKTQASYVINP